MSGSLPPSLGLRHLALRVRDLRAMEAFYVGLLGFQVEWRPDADNLYLALRGDSLALHQRETIAAHGALDHLGIAFAKAGDVEAWAARLEAAGVRVVEAPRAHRDGAFSCTVLDPEGNAVQLIYHPPIASFEERS